MHLPHTLVYLSLLIALGPVGLGDQTTHQQAPTAAAAPVAAAEAAAVPEDAEQCSSCEIRQQIKTMRLNAIKSQILSKLRLKHAPNISRDVMKQLLPKAPPLQELLDQYDVLGDDNQDGLIEEDDEHAVTETIMLIATERESRVRSLFSVIIVIINVGYRGREPDAPTRSALLRTGYGAILASFCPSCLCILVHSIAHV